MHDINFNEWPQAVNCAITVCDTDGVILYMNERARATFASHGDLIGKNLFACHSPQSQEKIRQRKRANCGSSEAYITDNQMY